MTSSREHPRAPVAAGSFPAPGTGAVSIACPECRRLVGAGGPCPHCGHVAPAPRDLTVVLDAPAGTTLPLEPVTDAPYARPFVDHLRPPTPTALPLAPQGEPPRPPSAVPFPVPSAAPSAAPPAVPFAAPAEPPLPPTGGHAATVAQPAPAAVPAVHASRAGSRRGPGVLAAAAALVLVAVTAVAGLRQGGDRPGGERTAATTNRTSSTAGAEQAVPRTSVRATASSTQRPDSGIDYGVANTLDGRPETAWNSDGKGAGTSLAYTFATPVDLTSITLLNGYQKVRKGSSGSPVDLFLLNQRVRTLRVVTDSGSTAWTLRDDRAPQTLTKAFGRTRSVRLQVTSTYASQKYDDLAVSEVSFTAR